MRALVAAMVIMGVLIVGGTAALIALLLVRVPAGPEAASVLNEPAGTHIAGMSATGDRIVLLLEGGGPDRVAVLDARSGRVVGRVGLAP